MSRRRDTNWSRDEITVLLDSIMEITKTRAEDGKRTNSREVFEYAAKMMGEKGHTSRAEREKCRTKWKKMKEEFTHAKRARDGDTRYKEAPGIQPFYERMEEFINGNFDNISPHSTIVRRSSNISSNNKTSGTSRTSARIAANTNGVLSNTDNNDTSSTIVTRTNASSNYTSSVPTPSNPSPSSRQNSRSSSGNSSVGNNNSINNLLTSTITGSNINTSHNSHDHHHHHHHNPHHNQYHHSNTNSNNNHQQQAVPNGELCTIYSYNNATNNNNNGILNNASDPLHHIQPAEHADISYRVSTGCRQITIFGDHDVDIKFRGDCVTINKISTDYPTT